jgi:hypothetical protein
LDQSVFPAGVKGQSPCIRSFEAQEIDRGLLRVFGHAGSRCSSAFKIGTAVFLKKNRNYEILMKRMKNFRFEWDHQKSQSNKKKHAVSFEDAQSVFLDPNARIISDPDHSDTEDRFILLGMSETLRILVVCHCYRGDENALIRIISARKATKQETTSYEDMTL